MQSDDSELLFLHALRTARVCRRGVGFGMAKDAALVVLVIQLRAKGAFSVSGQQKYLAGRKHTQGWRRQIDPQALPVAAANGGAESASRVRAHSGHGRFKSDARCNQKRREVA